MTKPFHGETVDFRLLAELIHMKVIIVSDTFAPDINGVARTLGMLARGLMVRGHGVEVVTTQENDGGDGPRTHVVCSAPLPGYAALRVGFTTMGWFASLFQRARPEVLYVATEGPLGIAAIWAAHRAGIPVVSGFHTNFHTYLSNYHLTGLQPVAEAFLRTVHNHTARTLAQSRDTAAMLTNMGVLNTGVLDHGVDSRLFTPAARDASLRRQWGVDAGTPVAIHVGRLAAEKNLSLLQRSFDLFMSIHPQGRCVIVGDGPCAAELKDACPDAIFAGMRKGAELACYYASGDVGIFPSTSETFGNVVLESLASGLATVTYDYAAGRQHIAHGSEGFLAPLHDEPAFLEQVSHASTRWNDANLRSAARQKAEGLSWDAVVTHFENELHQAMQSTLALSASPL